MKIIDVAVAEQAKGLQAALKQLREGGSEADFELRIDGYPRAKITLVPAHDDDAFRRRVVDAEQTLRSAKFHVASDFKTTPYSIEVSASYPSAPTPEQAECRFVDAIGLVTQREIAQHEATLAVLQAMRGKPH